MKSSLIQNAGAALRQRKPHVIKNAKEFDGLIRLTLKRLRAEIKISQLATAEGGRISQQSISNIETGKTERLSLSGMHDIVMACNAVVSIAISDAHGSPVVVASSQSLPGSAEFVAALRESLVPLQDRSGLSGTSLSQKLKLSPGTVSKIKNGDIALNTLNLYGFVEACRGEITATVHDRHKRLVLECSSPHVQHADEKALSQFGLAARDALQKIHSDHVPAKAARDTPLEVLSYIEATKVRGTNTTAMLDFLKHYDAEVVVAIEDEHGRRVKEFSSADPARFNMHARSGLASLREGRDLSPAQAARLLKVGPSAVRIMEDPTSERGLRLTALDRYVSAYKGSITFVIRDAQGQPIAEFSSANRPAEKGKKSKGSSSSDEPEVT